MLIMIAKHVNHDCIFSSGIILIYIDFLSIYIRFILPVSAGKTLKVQFYTWTSPSLISVQGKANINQIHLAVWVPQLTWRQILKTVSSLQVVN